MDTQLSRPHGAEVKTTSADGLLPSSNNDAQDTGDDAQAPTLASLPVGARLVLRCRKDWRDATIAAVSLESVTLSVGAPSGRTYRVRRPPDSLISHDGAIPVLGDGAWRAGRARYDVRW